MEYKSIFYAFLFCFVGILHKAMHCLPLDLRLAGEGRQSPRIFNPIPLWDSQLEEEWC